jgi:hypothetical protein
VAGFGHLNTTTTFQKKKKRNILTHLALRTVIQSKVFANIIHHVRIVEKTFICPITKKNRISREKIVDQNLAHN